jgi:hypothetical protein
MPIKIKCPHCQKALSINESMAGKRAACPACKVVLTIPSASTAPAAAAVKAPAPRPAPAKSPVGKPAPAAAPAPAPETPPEDIENLAASLLADEPKAEPVEAPKTVDFECPMCGEPVKMDVSRAGKQAPCPECKRIIKVPQLQPQKKLDWREAPNKPAGARVDTGPAPEGAWGSTTSRGRVSEQSLEEAGALPSQREPVSVRQWIARGMVAAAVIVALVGGTLFAISFFGGKKQEAALAKAMSAVTGKEATLKGPEGGLIHLWVSRYHLNRNEKDCADPEKGDRGARQQISAARGKLALGPSEKPNPERDALLIEIALAQIDMGGAGKALDERRKVSWTRVREELRQTIQAIHPPEGKDPPEARMELVRLVTRKLIEVGQAELAEDLARRIGDGPVSAAVAGVELLRAGQQEPAKRLNAIVMNFYKPEKPAAPDKPDTPKKSLPSLTVEVVALATVLEPDKPLPKPEDADQIDIAQIGKAVALALSGSMNEALALANKQRVARKVQALIAIADAVNNTEESKRVTEEAISVFSRQLGDQRISPWVLARLVRLGVTYQLSDSDLKTVPLRINNDPLRGWDELHLFRLQLSRESGKVDENLADSVDRNSLSNKLARIELVRHNVRKDRASVDAVEQWDKALQPFGYLGIALGLQDSK